MVSVIPSINTLIVDIGTENTRIGYAGAHRPAQMLREDPGENTVVRASVVADIERYVARVEGIVRRENVDSIILLVHSSEAKETKAQIAERLIARSFCSSFYIMESAVAETFGVGRLSASLLCCSAGSMTVAIVSNGSLIEYYKEENERITDKEFVRRGLTKAMENSQAAISDQVAESLLPTAALKAREIREAILPSESPVDISDILHAPAFFADPTDWSKIHGLLDKLIALRTAHKMVKTQQNGAIIFTGGYFRNPAFFSCCKQYLVQEHGATLSELILGADSAHTAFTGASIFGMNIESKPFFQANPNYTPGQNAL